MFVGSKSMCWFGFGFLFWVQQPGNGKLIEFLSMFSKEFGENAILGQEFFSSVVDTVITNEDLCPLLRVAFIATNITCSKDKVVDGFARLLTKSDFEKCKVSKMKASVLSVEGLLLKTWQVVTTSSNENKEKALKAWGKCCIRATLFLVNKQKNGREIKKYNTVDEIYQAFLDDMASKPAPAPVEVTASSTLSMPVNLDDAKNPMFLAKQSMEVKIGKCYSHKDLPHIFCLTEINADHVVLKAMELFPTAEKTIKVNANEITSHLKLLKTKPPTLLDTHMVTQLLPMEACKEENDRAHIFQTMFSIFKTNYKKMNFQDEPTRFVFNGAKVNKGELLLFPMTDKVDKVCLKPIGKVYATVIYNGTTWYVMPPKPWKIMEGKGTGLVVPFWVVQSKPQEEHGNMMLESKEVKGLKIDVLSNTRQILVNEALAMLSPKASGSSAKKARTK